MDDTAEQSPPRRTSETRQRSRFIAVRCTPEEHAAIIAAAQRAGLTAGAFMRRQAIGTPGPRSIRPPHPDRAQLARVLAAVGMLGSNVNQLARVANTTGELPAAERLEAIAVTVRDIRTALMRALGRGG